MADPAPRIPAAKAAQPAAPAAKAAPGAAHLAAEFGLQDDGAFILPFGTGLRLAPQWVGKVKAEVDKKHLPPLPGLKLDTVGFDLNNRLAMLSIKGKTAIPLTEERDFKLAFDHDGKPATFSVHTKATLDWLGRPELHLEWTPEEGLKTTLKVAAAKFVPATLAKVAMATGDVTLTLQQGQLSGDLDTVITVRDVLKAAIKGGFTPKGLAATVDLESQTKFLGEVKASGKIDAAGQLSARIEKQAAELPTPIRGLSFKGGTFLVALNNDRSVSGGFTDVMLDYAGLASATASFALTGGKYAGHADLDLQIPGMTTAKGSLAMKDGKLSGAFSLGKEAFPKGLPLKSGTISGTIAETGKLAFSGSVGVSLGPAGEGLLMASYADEGGFSIGAEVDLKVPGLQTAKFKIAYNGTDLAGSGELGIDPELLTGIEGKMQITYAEGLWAGETTLAYMADDGKLSGTITVRARQDEKKAIKISGEGEVTAKIAPKLQGKLKASILEEGGIDVSGSITVTDPVEMFPEKRFDKELINKSTSIPLWAILVAVLRIRAGIRAGIGPGVFRNITVTGSYSIGKAGEPSFAISGEMFIPAFVEGYVGFGAGLGLDVVLGELTGGIEAMGTAGIYGAISVIPELDYKDGDYSISGTATMAAGARLKLSLNAWAEVEALWITVWDKTWELASFTMPVGPDLGLSAKMAYTFGKGEVPTLDFTMSDVDSDKLISDAMPKDAPPGAGVKDETKNAAKWAGAQKAKGPAADAVPPDLAQKAKAGPPVAPAPGGKGKKTGAAPKGKPGAGNTLDPKTSAPADPAKSDKQAKDAATPDPKAHGTVEPGKEASTKTPRHPTQVSIAMLDEPPVPMPRSKDQQEADIDAAAKMVSLVAGKVGDTDAVDDYFAQVKTRFAVGTIAYQVDPGPEVSIKVAMNPDRFVKINEEIRNLPVPDLAKDNKIEFTMATRNWDLGGGQMVTDSVGIKMVASVLTPLHPKGSGPSDKALKNIFDHLDTQGPTGAHGYIKGHLLNDNLGGPGAAENLYPISQQANKDHSGLIEEEAKSLVNDQHYWVRYEVEIGNEKVSDVPGPPGGPKVISIDADLTATLSKLHTDHKNYTPVKSVVVKSRFNMKAADLADKTAKELSPKDLAERERAAAEFLKKRDINPSPNPDAGTTNESKELPLPPPSIAGPSTFKQTKVDQSLVQLSSAKGKGPATILIPGILDALRELAKPVYHVAPFDKASSLQDRLGAVAYGTSQHGLVAALGLKPALATKAAETVDPKGDIATSSLLSPDEREVLRQINSTDSAAKIMGVLTRMAEEKKAGDRLAQKGKDMTKTDWAYLAAKMEQARQSDRVALAALVARTFGSRTAGREAMQSLGIWDSSVSFYISVQTKVNALAP